jgi:lipopolysaccharide transport system ATP-binding protein
MNTQTVPVGKRPMSVPAIEARNLSKRYAIAHQGRKEGLRHALERAVRSPISWIRSKAAAQEEFWALRDVSFDVDHGEVVGIIGRNGAGKSTLLKLLSRITEPTTGRMRLKGRVASLLEVGTGFHPELTGRENIFLNGVILGMSRREVTKKFDEIVAFAGTEQFLDTPVKRYSSGMYVRLAFAVAAHLEPEILIVDEVLAVGDAEFQKKCINKMADVAATQGRTVIFVSHQMAAIQNLCTRCMLLDSGRLLKNGRTQDVINAYLSKASALATAKLSDRTDRQGRGDVRIDRVQLLDASGYEVQAVASGMDLVIRLWFAVRSGLTARQCSVRVAVVKDMRPLFAFGTDLVDKSSLDLSGSGHIDFIVPDWPLSGGQYHLSTYVASKGTTQDWVDDAATIDVVDGDYYGTGTLYYPGWQGLTVLVKHGWRMSEQRASLALTSAYD